jgi:hypothetical protein
MKFSFFAAYAVRFLLDEEVFSFSFAFGDRCSAAGKAKKDACSGAFY